MKITEAQGRACLESVDIPPARCRVIVLRAFKRIGWANMESGDDPFFDEYLTLSDHYWLALAMCAAIAGVKP